MKRIRVLHWTASAFWLLVASLFSSRNAAAEIVLLDKDGWQVFTEGRVGAFGSVAVGKSIPTDPAMPTLQVGVFGSGNEQGDTSGNVLASRLRSGMMPNILAFGFRRQLTEATTMRGYIALWASADTNRVKYTKSSFDVRQGYLQIDGKWGSFLGGRAMALFSRGNFEIDYLYQHGFGFGHPCRIDDSGESAGFTGGGTCGHIGFGVLHPSYDAGLAYATPSLSGLKLTVGIYDPVGCAGDQTCLPRTPYPRPEGEVTFERRLGDTGTIKLFANGMWQRNQKIVSVTDTAGVMTNALISRDAYGAGAGGRVEIGPWRFGVSGFSGKGVGTHVALFAGDQSHDVTRVQPTTLNYRRTDGFHGAVAGVFGRYMVNAGFGFVRVIRLTGTLPDGVTPEDTGTLPRQQYGISAGFNARISEALIFDIDFFRAHSQWYDRRSQDMNFVSSGLTMVW